MVFLGEGCLDLVHWFHTSK